MRMRCWGAFTTVRLWKNPFIDALTLFGGKRGSGRRILGIWDFNTQLSTVGDALAFQVMLNVLKIDHDAEKVDVCFIDDDRHPYARKEGFKKNLLWKRNIVATCEVNPFMGSLFLFDSNAQFSSFYHKFRHRYIPLPNPALPMPHVGKWKLLTDFFERRKYLPPLTCKPPLIQWALDFVRRHAFPAKPIVVQLRRNPRASDRNSPVEAWDDFFRSFADRDDLKFLIIGMAREIIPEFRKYRNVLFTKDHNTTIEQDLALIQVAHVGLFQASGVAVFPWFTHVPSCMFGGDARYIRYIHAIGPEKKCNFLDVRQRLYWGTPTGDFLIQEFVKMLGDLDREGWSNPLYNDAHDGVNEDF